MNFQHLQMQNMKRWGVSKYHFVSSYNPKYHKFMRRSIEYLIYQAKFHLVLIQIMSNWPLAEGGGVPSLPIFHSFMR